MKCIKTTKEFERAQIDTEIAIRTKGQEAICWEAITESRDEAMLWLEYVGFKNHNELIKRMRES